MKKNTPPRPPFFLQDFCKNAQWRAKKLRERGSNAARPTEKGGGGLPIGARPVDFGASFRSRFSRFRSVSVAIRSVSVAIRSISARRFGRFRSRFGRFRRVDSVVSVAIRSVSVASRRADSVGFGRFRSRRVVPIRARPVDFGASRRADSVAIRRDQRQDTKKARLPM